MKELLRKKLLEARNEFEKLEEKEKFKMFLVEFALCFDIDKNVIITIRNVAIGKDGVNFSFGNDEKIETGDKDIDIFMNLLEYAEDRYGDQFTYAIHPSIYCFHGKDMYSKKFEFILREYQDSKKLIDDKMGFAITEAIF